MYTCRWSLVALCRVAWPGSDFYYAPINKKTQTPVHTCMCISFEKQLYNMYSLILCVYIYV